MIKALACVAMMACVVCASKVRAEGAATYQEPARGSADRSAMMDALRPHAEWLLGAPVVFLVHDLRVAGDLGFASLEARRPGGAGIDIRGTPGFARGVLDPQIMDGTTLQALYVRSGDTWVAQFWELGATDVWYAAPDLCAVWQPVVPDACR